MIAHRNLNFYRSRKTIRVKGGDSDLRESFFEVNLGNHVELSVGKIRNAWGVSELFSPPVAVLPSRDDFTALVPSKVDFLEAQNQMRLTIFPTDKIEIELIAFGQVKNNKSTEINFQETLTLSDSGAFVDDDVEGNDFIERKLRYNRSEQVSKNRNPKSARVIFYPRWGQYGFTYYKGLSSFSPLLRSEIMGSEILVSNTFTNDEESYLYYPDAEMLAFEFQADRGNFTYRIEHAQIDTTLGVNFNGNIFLFPKEQDKTFTQSKVDEFLNAIGSTNAKNSAPATRKNQLLAGTGLYEGQLDLTALGLIHKGKKWTKNFALIRFDRKAKNAEGRRILKAYDALKKESSEFDFDFEYLPLFLITTKSGDRDQHQHGYALGVIGIGFGLGGFYNYNINDHLSFGMGLGYMDISDDIGFADPDYKTDGEGLPTVQANLAIKF